MPPSSLVRLLCRKGWWYCKKKIAQFLFVQCNDLQTKDILYSGTIGVRPQSNLDFEKYNYAAAAAALGHVMVAAAAAALLL